MNTKMPLSELGKTLGRTLAIGVAVLEAACGGSPATPTKQIVTEPTAARPPATATVEPTKTAFPTQEIKATATPEPATGGELPRVVAFRENILKQMLERSHPLYGAGSPPQIRAEDEDAPLGKAGWKIILKGEGFVGVQEYDKNGVNLGRVLTGLSKSKPGDQELITDVDFVPPDLVNQPYVVLAGKNLEWKNGTWYRDGNLSLGQSAKQLLSRDKMTWVNESDPATPTVAPTPKPNLTPPKVTPDTIITPAVKPTEFLLNANYVKSLGIELNASYRRENLQGLLGAYGQLGNSVDGLKCYDLSGNVFKTLSSGAALYRLSPVDSNGRILVAEGARDAVTVYLVDAGAVLWR